MLCCSPSAVHHLAVGLLFLVQPGMTERLERGFKRGRTGVLQLSRKDGGGALWVTVRVRVQQDVFVETARERDA